MNPSQNTLTDELSASEFAETIDDVAQQAVSVVRIRTQVLDDIKALARDAFAPHEVDVALVRRPADGVATDPIYDAAVAAYLEKPADELCDYYIGAVLSCFNNQVEQRAVAVLLWQRNKAGLSAAILGAPERHQLIPADASSLDAKALASFLRELIVHSFGIGTSHGFPRCTYQRDPRSSN